MKKGWRKNTGILSQLQYSVNIIMSVPESTYILPLHLVQWISEYLTTRTLTSPPKYTGAITYISSFAHNYYKTEKIVKRVVHMHVSLWRQLSLSLFSQKNILLLHVFVKKNGFV